MQDQLSTTTPASSLTTENGDIIAIARMKTGVIIHQVNCQKVCGGAGLAKQIANAYPKWAQFFQRTTPSLGKATVMEVAPFVFVASLYSQQAYGRDRRHTDYAAFRKALRAMASYEERYHERTPNYYMPFGIGCGLGGGDWTIIEAIIIEELPTAILVKRI